MRRADYNLLLSDERFIEQEEYWLEKLAGSLPETGLLPDFKRRKIENKEKATVEIIFSDSLRDKMAKLSKNADMPLYLLLLTALKCLLHLYTGNSDIITGSPVYRPNCTEETLNELLVIRDTITGEMTFKECLVKVRKTVLEAYDNQDYPFDRIAEKLGVTLAENGSPFFHMVCLLKNIHDEDWMEELQSDLVLAFEKNGGGLGGVAIYNPFVFSEYIIKQFSGHLTNLLACVLQNIDTRVSDITFLSEEERYRLIEGFNGTGRDYSCEKAVYELFEEQAEKTPDNIAVILGDRQWTYRQLNEKANQLARKLREMGVKAGRIVGMRTERSLEMVAGILAIWKAGGAYVPVDPEYPVERQKYMLEDSGADILLINNGKWTIDNGKTVVTVNLNDNSIFSGDGSNLEKVSQPDSLAYVIYTSGTTGRPKGVMVEHRAISNTIRWRRDEYRLDGRDRVLQLFSYAFDGFLTSFFTPVVSGAAVVLLDAEKFRDPAAIRNCIVSRQVTHFIAVPAMYAAILEQMRQEDFKYLRVVTLAGEKASSNLVKESREKCGELELVNEYGPTESAVAATVYRNMQEETVSVIGKPIANARVYIVNQYNQPQPVGVPGELCIAGAGLARGYLRRPELTAEKFIPDPFAPITHNPLPMAPRMYKTGDLARWLPDGNVEFLGRIDNQVKVRGYRIELGEIEAQLLSHQSVKEAVVVVREDEGRDGILCAYIVSNEMPEAQELKKYLSQTLPDYMIPSCFTGIEKIPLTPGGKLDIRALPEPGRTVEAGDEYEAPGDEVEAKLVEIWQNVLGLDRVGVNDDFFALGGHSLRATLAASQVYREFNVEVPLTEIFNSPTVKKLAAYIRGREESVYLPIASVEKREYYAVSSAQKRMFILNQMEGAEISYIVTGSVMLEGAVDKGRPEEVMKTLIRRHEAFRTSFELMDGEPVQRIHQEVDFSMNYMEAGEEELEGIVRGFVKPFDLGRAPLFRLGLVKVFPGEDCRQDRHLMIFNMHHIISDGLSTGILVREFSMLYDGKSLPEIGVQYKDFSAWQNEMFRSGRIKKQEEYWMNVFKDEIPVLNLPTDYPRPAIQSFEGEMASAVIDRELTAGLNALIGETGTTMYMLLLAVYNVLLSKYADQEDIVVGTAIAGRHHKEMENVIGVFINTLAMRNYPRGDKTFKEFLESVKENTLKAYENQDYQFEMLVDKLGLKRDISRNPVYDVMLTMQNMDDVPVEISGLKATPFSVDNKTAHNDMNIMAYERRDVVVLALEYCTRLFRRETIDRMAVHFINIVRQVTENPEIKLADIEVLTEEEKRGLLSGLKGSIGTDGQDNNNAGTLEAEFDI